MHTGIAMDSGFARMPLSTSGIVVRLGEYILVRHLLLLPTSSRDGMDMSIPYARRPVGLYTVPMTVMGLSLTN